MCFLLVREPAKMALFFADVRKCLSRFEVTYVARGAALIALRLTR